MEVLNSHGELDSWDPMAEDYGDPRFNAYGGESIRGRGRMLDGTLQPGAEMALLHVAKIPPTVTKQGLKNMFGKLGVVLSLEVFQAQNGRRYAKVAYSNLRDAVNAIKMFHNMPPLLLSVHHHMGAADRMRGTQFMNASEFMFNGINREELHNSRDALHAEYPFYAQQQSMGNFGTSQTNTPFEPSAATSRREESFVPVFPSRIVNVDPTKTVAISKPKVDDLNEMLARPCIKCGSQARFKCTACEGLYCSRVCQKNDWNIHKTQCRRSRECSQEHQQPAASRDAVVLGNGAALATSGREERARSPPKAFCQGGKAVKGKGGTAGNRSSIAGGTGSKYLGGGAKQKTVTKSEKLESKLLDNAHCEPMMKPPVAAAAHLPVAPPILVKDVPCLTFPMDRTVRVEHVHAQNPSSFYVMMCENVKELQEIMITMQEFVAASRMPEYVEQNVVVAAKYLDYYYRAAVKKANFDGSLVVTFLDYGNEETVPLEDVRILSADLCKTSRQAMCCTLDGVYPAVGGRWSEEAIALFKKEAPMESTLTVTCKKTLAMNYSSVILHNDNGTDIGEHLCRCGHAIRSNVTVSKLRFWKVEDELQLYFCALNGSCEVWAMYASASDDSMHLMTALDESFVPQPLDRASVKVGDLVVAHSSSMGAWGRAVVRAFTTSDFKVQFLDYGVCEDVTAVNVLPCELKNCPAMAVLLLEFPNAAEVDKLFEASSDVCVTVVAVTPEEATVELPMADCNCRLRALPVWHSRFTIGPQQQPLLAAEELGVRRLLPPETEDEVYLARLLTKDVLECPAIHVIISELDLPVVYVLLVDNIAQKALKLLEDELVETYKSLEAAPLCHPPDVGDVVCATFEKDDDWYRARVESIVSESEARVCYIDYGNMATIRVANMRPLLRRYATLPALALKVMVANDADAILSGANAADAFKMRVIDPNSDPPVVTVVVDGNEPRRTTFVQLPVGQEIDLFLYEVNEAAELLCGLCNQDAMQTMDQLVQHITEHCEQSPKATGAVFVKDSLCLAKSTLDEQWYRAKVKRVSDGGAIRVFYLDYGNEEEVDADAVRPMLSSFLTMPFQVLHCQLEGVSATKDLVTQLKARCNTMCKVKVLREVDAGIYAVSLIK